MSKEKKFIVIEDYNFDSYYMDDDGVCQIGTPTTWEVGRVFTWKEIFRPCYETVKLLRTDVFLRHFQEITPAMTIIEKIIDKVDFMAWDLNAFSDGETTFVLADDDLKLTLTEEESEYMQQVISYGAREGKTNE